MLPQDDSGSDDFEGFTQIDIDSEVVEDDNFIKMCPARLKSRVDGTVRQSECQKEK